MATKTTTFLAGASVQTIVTLVMGVLEIAVFALFSRLLTKTDFGYYAVITAIVAVFYSISEAGLGSAIIQKKEDSSESISTAFTLSVICGSSFSLLLFLTAPFLAKLVADSTITVPLRIISIILLLNSLNSIARGILSRKLAFIRLGIIQVCAYIISSIVGLFLAYKGFGLYAIVAFSILYPLFTCVAFYVTSVKMPKFYICKNEARGIISFGGWLTAGVILNNLSHQVDKLMLSRLLSVETLGAYNRPSGFITQISDKFNSIFDSVLFPMLSKLQDDAKSVRNIYYRASGLLNVFSVLLTATLGFNAEFLVQVFFGSQWLDLVPILQISSITVLLMANGRLVDCFFRSLNLVRLGFYLRIVALLTMVTAIVIGSKFGLYGIALGAVASSVITIIVKMTALSLKIHVRIGTVMWNWLMSLRILLPPGAVFAVKMCIWPYASIYVNSILCVAVMLSILVECIYFPNFIGEEYYSTLYPKVAKILKKRI